MSEERKFYRLRIRLSGEEEFRTIAEHNYLDEALNAIKVLSNPEHDFLIDGYMIEVEVEEGPEGRTRSEQGAQKG